MPSVAAPAAEIDAENQRFLKLNLSLWFSIRSIKLTPVELFSARSAAISVVSFSALTTAFEAVAKSLQQHTDVSRVYACRRLIGLLCSYLWAVLALALAPCKHTAGRLRFLLVDAVPGDHIYQRTQRRRPNGALVGGEAKDTNGKNARSAGGVRRGKNRQRRCVVQTRQLHLQSEREREREREIKRRQSSFEIYQSPACIYRADSIGLTHHTRRASVHE